MPGRPRKTKKKAPLSPSESSKRKLRTIAKETEEETIESYLADFDIQTATFKKQAQKLFQAEAKKWHLALPDKSSIPKEIHKMTLEEFNCRGGSFMAVMESLKREKAGHVDPTSLSQNSRVPLSELRGQENKENDRQLQGGTKTLTKRDFMTPASTRSQAIVGAQCTEKRNPKPLEQVSLQMWSQQGSPVDEHTFLQLQRDHMLQTVTSQLLEDTAKMPWKWRSRVLKSLKSIRTEAMKQDSAFVTPMVTR